MIGVKFIQPEGNGIICSNYVIICLHFAYAHNTYKYNNQIKILFRQFMPLQDKEDQLGRN